jgi:hypothetical protein
MVPSVPGASAAVPRFSQAVGIELHGIFTMGVCWASNVTRTR